MHLLKLVIASLSLGVIASCAHVPEAIQGESFYAISPTEATAAKLESASKEVRWGGVITEIVNNETETWIEVLALPLSSSGKPIQDRKQSLGRFIAKTNQFLDPEVYEKGLRITLVGTLDGTTKGKVGERDYVYPNLAIKSHYLWPRSYVRSNYLVSPGYWYYGHHPYWRFGYPFYGYGVWHYSNYYPYFPIYGYMSRTSHPQRDSRRNGDFSYSRDMSWHLAERKIQYFQHAQVVRNQARFPINRFPGQAIGATKPGSNNKAKMRVKSKPIFKANRAKPIAQPKSKRK